MSPSDLTGAINSLLEFINNNKDALVAKQQDPDALAAPLKAAATEITTLDGLQEQAKTKLRDATRELNNALDARYTEFSSAVDLIAGALGKQTTSAKQAQAIRKPLTDSKKKGKEAAARKAAAAGQKPAAG